MSRRNHDFFCSTQMVGKSAQSMELILIHLINIGRIPVLIDNTGVQPFSISESSAELLYLIEMVDKDHHFSFSNSKEQSQMMQWLIFWHASAQPNQGQLNHFGRFAPEQIRCKRTSPVSVMYQQYPKSVLLFTWYPQTPLIDSRPRHFASMYSSFTFQEAWPSTLVNILLVMVLGSSALRTSMHTPGSVLGSKAKCQRKKWRIIHT
jgi:hypothetical protein